MAIFLHGGIKHDLSVSKDGTYACEQAEDQYEKQCFFHNYNSFYMDAAILIDNDLSDGIIS